MDTNDFYEDDESIEERSTAWKAGERGTTTGSRDLNQRAKSIVDRVVARWDEADNTIQILPTPELVMTAAGRTVVHFNPEEVRETAR